MNIVAKFVWLVVSLILFAETANAKGIQKESIVFTVNHTVMVINAKTIESATLVSIDKASDEWGLKLTLKKEAADKLKAISSQNMGKQAQISLNGVLVSSPVIRGVIGAEFIIMGIPRDKAKKFVESIGQ